MTPGSVQWRVSTVVDGCPFRWGRIGADFVAEWPGLLTVQADAAGSMKAFVPAPDVDPASVTKLLRGAALAFVRSIAGKLSLHASAVACDGGALVCVGPSGSGKSTLAAAACRVPGVRFLADDVAAVDRSDGEWWVSPTETSHWLARGVDPEDKLEVPAQVVESSSARLRVLVAPRFEEAASGIGLRRLHGSEAFEQLLSTPLRFELAAAVWRGELDALTSLGGQVPVFVLTRSRSTPAAEAAARLVDLLKNPADWT